MKTASDAGGIPVRRAAKNGGNQSETAFSANDLLQARLKDGCETLVITNKIGIVGAIRGILTIPGKVVGILLLRSIRRLRSQI